MTSDEKRAAAVALRGYGEFLQASPNHGWRAQLDCWTLAEKLEEEARAEEERDV